MPLTGGVGVRFCGALADAVGTVCRRYCLTTTGSKFLVRTGFCRCGNGNGCRRAWSNFCLSAVFFGGSRRRFVLTGGLPSLSFLSVGFVRETGVAFCRHEAGGCFSRRRCGTSYNGLRYCTYTGWTNVRCCSFRCGRCGRFKTFSAVGFRLFGGFGGTLAKGCGMPFRCETGCSGRQSCICSCYRRRPCCCRRCSLALFCSLTFRRLARKGKSLPETVWCPADFCKCWAVLSFLGTVLSGGFRSFGCCRLRSSRFANGFFGGWTIRRGNGGHGGAFCRRGSGSRRCLRTRRGRIAFWTKRLTGCRRTCIGYSRTIGGGTT